MPYCLTAQMAAQPSKVFLRLLFPRFGRKSYRAPIPIPHMKDAVKYATSLLAFIFAAFVLSWAAVYSFWYAPRLFHSVEAVRACDAIGAVILTPVRTAFWCFGDIFDQSPVLSDPVSYAGLNGVLLGSVVYFCCRQLMFGRRSSPPQ